jgi:hypothetical protein
MAKESSKERTSGNVFTWELSTQEGRFGAGTFPGKYEFKTWLRDDWLWTVERGSWSRAAETNRRLIMSRLCAR